MSQPKNDDLSELLNEIAESQQRQEEELKELSGATHNPPALEFTDEPIDAVLADETAQSIAAPVMEPAVDENAIATERIEPAGGPREHRPVDDLIDIQHAQTADHDADAADMLAQLAQETSEGEGDGGPAFPEPAAADAANDLAAALAGEGVNEAEEAESSPVNLGSAAGAPRQLPTPQPSRRAAAASTRPARPKQAGGLAAVFAPVMLTLGTIMLFPAIWAVLILMGMKVWMHDGQGVDTMAKIMLACWPVALGLLAGGVMAIVNVSREKAKQRERDEANAARRAAR